MTQPRPQIDDKDIDAFVGQWLSRLNPAVSADDRAEGVRDFVVGLLKHTEQDKSDEWIAEFARRVGARVRWMTAR